MTLIFDDDKDYRGPTKSEPERVIMTQTERGLPVELRYYSDHADGMGPAMTLDMIEAYVNDEPVGYLKLSYLSQEFADKYYNDPFSWMVNKAGGYYKYRKLALQKPDESTWDKENLITAIGDFYGHVSQETRSRWETSDSEQLREEWNSRKKLTGENIKDVWSGEMNYHLAKPKVDFIRVYEAGDADRQFNGNGQKEETEFRTDWRGQGIGNLLYRAGAIWMHEKGMQMFASTSQSPSAKKAWGKLAKEHDLKKEIGDWYGRQYERYIFDGANLELPGLPRPVLSEDRMQLPEVDDSPALEL